MTKRPMIVHHDHIPHVHYIRDEYNGAYRIWQSWDPGDVFDMIPIREFEPHVLALAKKLDTLFIADFPQGDDGKTVCERCIKNGR